ncbi:restriction endonuclease subunit S [Flavonifractor plautii]|uniref:restriction endonuclease subunit S n=1 Tax=Flavonifractor plautii TaxID=292800 RepID=UPI0032C1BB41
MTGQQLKNSILQMAVQGKLVPQDPNDEPASVLLERIRKEKEQLIKEGKIKKEKNPSYIFRGADNLPYEKVGKNEPVCIADEVPFEIPESWEWARLGTILHKLSDGTHSRPQYVPSGIPFISVKDVSGGKLDFSDCKYITEEEHRELYSRCNPERGDILLTKVGTTGIPVIVDTTDEFSLFVSVALLKFNQELLFNEYLVCLINSPLVQKQAEENTRGVGNKNWVMRDIANTLIVIPPLLEQQRIVSKLQEILSFADNYAQAYSKAEELNKSFPELLKKSILQEAVQGKLVPQDPSDEPASVLLERIRAEKEQLIKAGKIKRDKHESVIFRRDNSHYEKLDGIERCIDDEIPFDLPESWEWVRFFSVVDIATNLVRPEEYADYIHIAPDNIEKATGTLFECHTVQQDKVVSPNHLFYKGQIIYSKIRPLLRKAVIAPFDGLCSADMYPLNTAINRKYLLRYMLSDAFNLQVATAMSSRVKMPKINQDELSKILIPIPPMQEQERIVSKIEELFNKITLI